MAKKNKAYDIIAKEFDSRCCTMVIAYILDTGMKTIEQITDEHIASLDGNGLMTQDFVQTLVRTARKVCKECSMDEIVKLIHSEWATN